MAILSLKIYHCLVLCNCIPDNPDNPLQSLPKPTPPSSLGRKCIVSPDTFLFHPSFPSPIKYHNHRSILHDQYIACRDFDHQKEYYLPQRYPKRCYNTTSYRKNIKIVRHRCALQNRWIDDHHSKVALPPTRIPAIPTSAVNVPPTTVIDLRPPEVEAAESEEAADEVEPEGAPLEVAVAASEPGAVGVNTPPLGSAARQLLAAALAS